MLSALKSMAVIAVASVAFQVSAQQRNDVPSCYDYVKLSEHKTTEIERELFVIVDQTVLLDINMKKNVAMQLANFGHGGDKITLVTFSAMAVGEYTNIPFSGYFEKLPSKDIQNNLNAKKLKTLKACLKKQAGAIGMTHKALKESFNNGEHEYPATELVGTVLTIGNDLVSQSKAKRKIVLLASDMLENSETLSFYSKGKVNVPNAQKAYDKFLTQGFEGDFANSEMHVIGAGFIHGGKSYNSAKSMIQLEKFWKMVFASSNVQLMQFGKPNLLNAVN